MRLPTTLASRTISYISGAGARDVFLQLADGWHRCGFLQGCVPDEGVFTVVTSGDELANFHVEVFDMGENLEADGLMVDDGRTTPRRVWAKNLSWV